MNTERRFVDSNVLLYWAAAGDEKAEIAERILLEGPNVSAQVLNEIVSVLRRKHKMNWPKVETILETVKELCPVEPLTLLTHERGVEIASVTGIRIYDACIVAAAELSGCDVLYTEDMNHGQRIGRVSIRNPFA